MSDNEIIDLVNKSLVEEFELEWAVMKPESTFADDLGLDSLDAVDMIIVLEQAFHFKIRESESIKSIKTLQDLYSFLIERRHLVIVNN